MISDTTHGADGDSFKSSPVAAPLSLVCNEARVSRVSGWCGWVPGALNKGMGGGRGVWKVVG
jgi:hypothetical protein